MENKPKFTALQKFLGNQYSQVHARLIVKDLVHDIGQAGSDTSQLMFRSKFICSDVLGRYSMLPAKLQHLAIAAAVEEMESRGIQLPKHGIASKCDTCTKCKAERALLELKV